MNTETINQVKEVITTLNLESETMAEILNEIMPLLWWHLVYKEIAVVIICFSFLAFAIYNIFN